MKKTVSWSAEAMKRDAFSVDATRDDEGSSNDKPITKSSSSVVPVSSAQVNNRIQQMIAMQKAQNAAMRQLMSTKAVTSASPSGLRDLVRSPCKYSLTSKGGEQLIGNSVQAPSTISEDPPSTAAPDSNLHGVSKMEPMKPPAPLPTLQYPNQPSTYEVAGIHFQGSQNINAFLPPHQVRPSHTYQEVRSSPSPIPTPPHLHPKIPNYGGHDENDSPVSYNSVLDQNLAPHHIVERNRTQHQLQVIQSQTPLMELRGDNASSFHASEQPPLPVPNVANMNAGAIREYSSNLSGRLPAPDPNAGLPHKNPITSRPETNFPQIQQNVQAETLFYNAYDRDAKAISPLTTHTCHKFLYGSNAGRIGAPHFIDNSYGATNDQTRGGNVNTPLDQDQFDASSQRLQSRIHRRRRNILLAIICYPFRFLLSSEQLCRSFCFGAIDGLITGASIFSACVGLGLVSQPFPTNDESTYVKWMPLALTLSAALSDGICMAIGHVWSTRLVAGAAFEERKEELRNFEMYRSDAKARLVETLLSRGMLKIDAMCLADTLEGYPDLFVSALLGGGFCADGNNSGPAISHSGLGSGGGMVQETGEATPLRQSDMQTGNESDIPPMYHGTGVASRNTFNHESYCDSNGFSDDPDLKALSDSVSESKLEGIVMMLSFSSFSVVPSLLYVFLPPVVYSAMANVDAAILMSMSITAGVMFVLGAWKSCFYSADWFLFGLKNMAVLVICTATAYSFGFVCSILMSSHK